MMIALLLGIMLSMQTADTAAQQPERAELPVLHDSLRTVDEDGFEHIPLTALEGWKFKSGDHATWANPGYDDNGWLEVEYLSQIADSLFNGIGWLRLSFEVDSSFRAGDLHLFYLSQGASEVYLDGESVASFGTPSPNPEHERIKAGGGVITYFNPVDLQTGEKYVIAIRYSLHDYAFYKFFGESYFPPVELSANIYRAKLLPAISTYYKMTNASMMISSVILLMVLCLHLSMYLRFREERGNFWIALISLFLLVVPLLFVLQAYEGAIPPKLSFLFLNISSFVLIVTPICLIPAGIGRLLDVPVRKAWFILPLVPVTFVLINLFFQFETDTPYYSNSLLFGLLAIVLGASTEIIWKAYKAKRAHVWLISAALLSYPLILILGSLIFNFLDYSNPVLSLFLFTLLLTMLPIGMSVYQMTRFFNAHGKLEEKVRRRTAELEKAYEELQQSLKDLKSTQQQLVQQEKLASLGQLTAGIAHEIKNPLNFVNNFSDLSVELVEEAREEVKDKLSTDSQELTAILDDIEVNLRKIHEHGSRADDIVKSMLQHSRGGSGEMESTDLNELVKEYVNLSFHGMRAGNDPINVDIEMDLDEKIDEVRMIGEDFGRVIVNLCNNAFDAMREKASGKGEMAEEYVPKLMVRTNRDNGQVTIEIEDNGPGIPEEMRDKILQPFFTTKKGTEGTGLGLSITNDIIKAHGGQLEIESSEDGSVFRIQLI